MSPETYAHVSNLLIPTATIIYALAMMSHAMEWALGRSTAVKAAAVKEEVLVAADGEQVTASSATDHVDETTAGSTERMEAASRIGLMLTWLAFVFHLGGVVTRGLAAGRVPWGNMYEF
ncbi:MAG TPA: c-type cytochrome biogenesis protein CcsB, partial [Kribbella sp.]|nr:c-type cytochrome biogenesis protein CcsB [Kribbella sp.]